MGTNAALITRNVIENSFQVMAIHLMSIAQAVDCLGASKRLSPATRKVYEDVRALFPAFVQDQPMYEQMKRVQDYLRSVEENID